MKDAKQSKSGKYKKCTTERKRYIKLSGASCQTINENSFEKCVGAAKYKITLDKLVEHMFKCSPIKGALDYTHCNYRTHYCHFCSRHESNWNGLPCETQHEDK